MALLELKDVSASYGVIQALFGVSLTVNEGEIVCLIGANGAGKTTTVKAITGTLPITGGEIKFLGDPIHTRRTSAIVRSGIACVPEGRRVFPEMTVQENLEIGGYVTRKDKEKAQSTLDYIFEMFPRLEERRNQAAGTLSGGEQAMLVLGRAMMSHPKLMVLDEPSMGLAPVIVETAFEVIQQVNEAGCSILLVEQNANMALSISDRGYVLEGGEVKLEASAEELQNSELVQKLYLGAV
ncbi:MAG: ABC transporter ATP-binding protein [Firmicutes bacterium]|nr:ABC transporter ATP-binding protein [Bacillota bacterium]